MTENAKKWRLYSKLYLLATLAFLSLIAAVQFFNIERLDRKAMFNAGIDVLGLFICVALFYGCMDEDNIDLDVSTHWLLALIFVNGISFFNNELSWYVSGVAEYRQLFVFLSELSKIFDLCMTMLFYNYVRRMLEFKGKLAEWLNKYIFILLIPFLVMVFANSFMPINFVVDDQGVFRTMPLYHLIDLYGNVVIPLTVILVFRCKAPAKEKATALLFLLTPVIHYLATKDAIGYASRYGATLFAVTQVYSVMFSDNNKKLATTKAELSVATKIQKAIMPESFPAFPERKEFNIYASMEPAREVGGDFYDFYLVDDDHLCIVMADVSGKGVPGAMFMMVSKIIMKNSVMLGQSPAEALTELNKAFCASNKEEMFVTVWIGIMDLSTGLIEAVNAGHEHPIIMKNGKSYELLKDRHHVAVGINDEAKYEEYEIQMEKGDKLFLYTDGIPEAVNRYRKQFGLDNLIKALNEATDCDPELTLAHVKEAVDLFVKDAEQFDDLTMMCVEYYGKDI